MKRITKNDFFRAADSLGEALGIPVTTNCWHRHFSVYTDPDQRNVCHQELVSSNTARDACDQMRAIKNALYALRKRDERAN